MLYWFRKCVTSDVAPMRNTTARSGGAHERGGDKGLQQSNPIASSVTSTTRQREDRGENGGRGDQERFCIVGEGAVMVGLCLRGKRKNGDDV